MCKCVRNNILIYVLYLIDRIVLYKKRSKYINFLRLNDNNKIMVKEGNNKHMK